MQKSLRLLSAVALIGLGVWGWFLLFPGPERVIRSRLSTLARTVSFEPRSGTIARGYGAQKAAGFFTLEAGVSLEVRGVESLHFHGREEIMQALLTGARRLRGLKVEFLDINVTVAADRQTATADRKSVV